MNGLIDPEVVLDSCTCINFLNRNVSSLPKGVLYISVISRMEILANPKHTAESFQTAKDFLQDLMVIPLIDEIEGLAVLIRRNGLPRPKLPDAVVAATALYLQAPLITQDEQLLKLRWNGLTIRSFPEQHD